MKKILIAIIFIMTVACFSFAACSDNGKNNETLTYTVNISANDSEFGDVSKTTVEGVSYGTSITASGNIIKIGETEVIATPKTATVGYSYAFVDWTAKGSITGDTYIIANFSKTANKYNVKVSVNNQDFGSVNKTEIKDVPYGTPVNVRDNIIKIGNTEIIAKAKSDTDKFDYDFIGWTTTENIAGETEIIANFSRTAVYSVSVVLNDSEYGSVSNTNLRRIPYGTAISVKDNVITIGDAEITATPIIKTPEFTYSFVGWKTTNKVLRDTKIIANFTKKLNKYTVTVSANNSEFGSVSATEITDVPYGTPITVSDNVIKIGDAEITAKPSSQRGFIFGFSEFTGITTSVQGDLDIVAMFTKEEKPVVDISSLCVDDIIGVLGANTDKEQQHIKLPESIIDEFGGVPYLDTVLIADVGWNQAISASGYDAENGVITFDSSTITIQINNFTQGHKVFDCIIEGENALYAAKIEFYGLKHPLRILETADDITENFDTHYYDNSANGGSQWDYYNYVLANDIEGGTIAYTADGNNKFNGVIDGRGHVLKHVTIGSNGLINYAFVGTLKNIAIVNPIGLASSDGIIATWIGNNATVENVYISCTAINNGAIFRLVGGKANFNNVIMNVKKSDSSAGTLYNTVYTSFDSWTQAENVYDYVSENNVIAVDDDFFTTYAGGLPEAWNGTGFALEDNKLRYFDNILMANLVPEVGDKVLAYLEAQGEDEQTISLPYSLGEINNFKIGGKAISATHVSDTDIILINRTELNGLTKNVELDCTFESEGATHYTKVYYTDYVLRTADDITNKLSNTRYIDETSWAYYSFVFANDIEGGTITYTADGNNRYNGVIDGRGHVLKNVTIGSHGLINYAFAGTLKNIAIVDPIGPAGSDGIIAAWIGNNATVENVYISCSTVTRGAVFTRVGGKANFNNVIYKVSTPSGSAGMLYETVYTSFTSWTQAENVYDYVSENNVIAVDDDFFTTYVDGLPEAWDGTGFKIEDETLLYNDVLILS